MPGLLSKQASKHASNMRGEHSSFASDSLTFKAARTDGRGFESSCLDRRTDTACYIESAK